MVFLVSFVTEFSAYALSAILIFAVFFFYGLRRFANSHNAARSIGFFHPYANTCGGGERVLWCAIKALDGMGVKVYIYTGDIETDEEILTRCTKRFNIVLENKPNFIRLGRRHLLEAATWPRFTMLGQSLGSVILGFEALLKFTPDIFIDTTGCAFTLPLAYYFGCRTAAYVHYPTISGDMLKKVADRRPTYNNQGEITNSISRTYLKLLYYNIFAFAYGFAGYFTDIVMVNSSWTAGHIRAIWKRDKQNAHVVYPPCDTKRLQKLKFGKRDRAVISIGQYRPEKDQRLQIDAICYLLQEHENRKKFQDVQLVIIGSCRNPDDEALADSLVQYAKEKGVSDNVMVLRNVSWDDLVGWLGRAEAGIHTMWMEHFGIGVVEMQAAGAIPIAHRSAGPKMDIVVPSYNYYENGDSSSRNATGFLAGNAVEYAEAMSKVFMLSETEKTKIRQNGRRHASECFSEELFCKRFVECLQPILKT